MASAVPAQPAPATPRGDRWLKRFAWLVLIILIGITFYISYRHLITMARRYGEPEDTARLFPLAIDGLIIMASLVMLHCTRARVAVPRLARLALWLGIGATLTGNAAHGLSSGLPGALVSGTSALVLVISVELFMRLLRAISDAAPVPVVERVVYRDRQVPVEVVREMRVIPRDRYDGARWTYENSLEPGARRVGRRSLATQWGITEVEARQIQDEVDAERESSTDADPLANMAPYRPEPVAASNGKTEAEVA